MTGHCDTGCDAGSIGSMCDIGNTCEFTLKYSCVS